jgi:hypothetical protein
MNKQHGKYKIHKFNTRLGYNEGHHLLIPSGRGGETIMSNMFELDGYRHDAWHLLFPNKTLFEIICFFERGKNIHERLELLPNKKYREPAIHLLFGDKTLNEIIKLLQKVYKIKKSQKQYIKIAA